MNGIDGYHGILTSLDTGEVVESTNSGEWTYEEKNLLREHPCHFRSYKNDKPFTESYYKKGNRVRHRLDGPAYIDYVNGEEFWYIDGMLKDTVEEYVDAVQGILSDEELMLIRLKYW